MTRSIDDFGSPELPHIEVGMGEQALLQGRGILLTDAIETCVGLSAYDYPTRTGFLAHVQPGVSLESHIEVMRENFSSPHRLRVWLGGLQNVSIEGDRTFSRSMEQEHVTEVIRFLGVPIERISTRWLASHEVDYSLGYALNVGTGEELVVVNNPEEDDLVDDYFVDDYSKFDYFDDDPDQLY